MANAPVNTEHSRKGALYLGKISGIGLFIHWTFMLLIVWIIFSGTRRGWDVENIIWYILFVLSVFVCVTLHEFGHALAARKYNIKTRDITLLPIGGLARLEKMPEVPSQELVVAFAGPAVNVIIAGFLYVFLIFTKFPTAGIEAETINSSNFLFALLQINIVLVVFNLIPAFPMDGGRVLRALLAMKMDRVKATQIAAVIGQVLAVGFIVIGFFYNPFLIFIGFFIILGARVEAHYARTSFALKSIKVKDIIMKNFTSVSSSNTLSEAAQVLLNGQSTSFLVLEGETIVGTLSRSHIIRGLMEKGAAAPVSDVMDTNVKFIDPEEPIEKIYRKGSGAENNIYPVMLNGKLIGAVDTENIREFILINNALTKGS